MQRIGYHTEAIIHGDETTHVVITPYGASFRLDSITTHIDGGRPVYNSIIKSTTIENAIQAAHDNFERLKRELGATNSLTFDDIPPEHKAFKWDALSGVELSDFDIPDSKGPNENATLDGLDNYDGTSSAGLSDTYAHAGQSKITVSIRDQADGAPKTFKSADDLKEFIDANGVLTGFELNQQNLDHQVIEGAALPYSDLSDNQMNGGSYQNNDFSFSNLDNTAFEGSDLSGTRFHAAFLRDTNFKDTILNNVDFRNADLEGADFTGADLTDADLRGVDLSKLKTPLTAQQLASCRHDLRDEFESFFRKSPDDTTKHRFAFPLTKEKLAAFVTSQSFRQRFKGAIDLEGQDARNIILNRSHLRHAKLAVTMLDKSRMVRADLEHSDLRYASLQDVMLSMAKLADADLTLANGYKASFANADLTNSVCHGTNFVKADFKGATLIGTDFKGADLSAADLRGCDLSQTKGLKVEQLLLAKIDRGTKLPDHISLKMIENSRQQMIQQRQLTP